MVEKGMVQMAMDLLYKPDSSITQLLVMLLVNLTQLDAGIKSLLQVNSSGSCYIYIYTNIISFYLSEAVFFGPFIIIIIIIIRI